MTSVNSSARIIERSAALEGDVARCWQHLTNPEQIRLWFADVEGNLDRIGSSFAFHFGDGDYFSGSVLQRDEPRHLQFMWQFMGIGGTSVITMDVQSVDEQSCLIKVSDEGDYSDRGVSELSEGWDDFLSRLARRMRTGENSRYRWSEQIDVGIIVAQSAGSTKAFVQDVSRWKSLFPDNCLELEGTQDGAAILFRDSAWTGCETKATVRVSERSTGSGISVSHGGWTELPQEIQFHERKRFASLWGEALRRAKHEFTGKQMELSPARAT